MRPRLVPIAGLVLATAVVAGCGSDSSSASSEPSKAPAPTVTATVTETATPTETSASPKLGPQQCAPEGDITIKIFLGRIDCGTAYDVAARVDRQGAKRQSVGSYVCEFGNAMTRPTIFTCTNDTLRAEFAADER